MFARIFEMTLKPEKKPELLKTIKDQVLPTVKKFEGFIDAIYMEVETEPHSLIAITLWREKHHEQMFATDGAPKVKTMLEPFLSKPPLLKVCKVDETLSTRKVIGVAA